MSSFSYRRELRRRDLWKAVGAGVGAGVAAGLAAGYLAAVFLQRRPLHGEASRHPDGEAPIFLEDAPGWRRSG